MAKPEWGIKRTCQSCATAFYDFNKSKIVCPACSAEYDPENLLKSRRLRAAPAEPPPKKPAPVATSDDPEAALSEAGIEDVEIDTEELPEGEDVGIEEEEEIEDASELGEDEDDMAEVAEHIEDERER
ncbi:MAG: TIGR02300 family protein [Alphaproteobacteria bacterium]